MGQQDIYDFLKKNKNKWFTSKQIAEHMDYGKGSVTMNLYKLRKTNMVEARLLEKRGYEYKYNGV